MFLWTRCLPQWVSVCTKGLLPVWRVGGESSAPKKINLQLRPVEIKVTGITGQFLKFLNGHKNNCLHVFAHDYGTDKQTRKTRRPDLGGGEEAAAEAHVSPRSTLPSPQCYPTASSRPCRECCVGARPLRHFRLKSSFLLHSLNRAVFVGLG